MTQVAKTKDTLEQFRDGILQRRETLMKELSAYGVSFDTFMVSCIAAARNDMEVFKSRTDTIWTALMRAARDGLLPDGKEGVIVHFHDKKQGDHIAQWMPMAQGLIKRIHAASTSGVKTIICRTVHEGDAFRYWIDDEGEHINFEPVDESEKIVKAFCIVVYQDGSRYVEVMTAKDIAAVREAAKQDYIWKAWPGEMTKKSVIRRIVKRLPLDRDKADFSSHDEMFDLDKEEQLPEGIAPPKGPPAIEHKPEVAFAGLQNDHALDEHLALAREKERSTLDLDPANEAQPILEEVQKTFPEAEIVEVREPAPTKAPPAGPPKGPPRATEKAVEASPPPGPPKGPPRGKSPASGSLAKGELPPWTGENPDPFYDRRLADWKARLKSAREDGNVELEEAIFSKEIEPYHEAAMMFPSDYNGLLL